MIIVSKNNVNTKAEIGANWVGDGFLIAARRLREIQDDAPEQFELVAKILRIGRRKAFYLAHIDRAFRDLGVDDATLTAVGWSKLRMLCEHVTKDNCAHLLKIASSTSAEGLRRILKHEPSLPNARCVTLYFSQSQYEIFAKAILTHGGAKSGKGLVNKEASLIKALSATGQVKNIAP
jgi:hypothetical protein